MTLLAQLHADIETRVQPILENRPEWPCGKGCDNCCRQLADVPQLTLAEWELLREGLAKLTPEQLQIIRSTMATMSGKQIRPITCPLLNLSTGTCPVYIQRPVACRTYGFYMQRGIGLYCNDIESQVAEDNWADVVWGNHDAIDHRLASLGENHSLNDWFERWIVENE